MLKCCTLTSIVNSDRSFLGQFDDVESGLELGDGAAGVALRRYDETFSQVFLGQTAGHLQSHGLADLRVTHLLVVDVHGVDGARLA